MEDFLPILIGIIWLAITWYNKDQKKKQRAAASKPKAENRKREPSILEQILTGQEIKINPPRLSSLFEEEEEEPSGLAPVQPEQGNSSPFLHKETAEFLKEGQSALKYERIPVYKEEFDKEEFNISKRAGIEEFDLRKAVIYSEILHPPYIDYK